MGKSAVALMECRKVSKTFSTKPPVQPLHALDLQVHAGEVACVTGVSGKGKSTLLNVMGGLLRPDANGGQVLFRGEDLAQAGNARLDELHRRGIGFVLQSPHLFAALDARENLVACAKMCKANISEGAIDAALEEFGLAERASHLPAELSVGQRRRLVVARTMLIGHDVILADEPTNDLDEYWSDFVFDRFRRFASEGQRAVVLVTHDQTYANRADSVYVLKDGALERREGAGHDA